MQLKCICVIYKLKMSANSTEELGTKILVKVKVINCAHLQFTLKAYISISLCPTTRYQEILGDPSVLVREHSVDSSPASLPLSMSVTLTLLSGFALKGS